MDGACEGKEGKKGLGMHCERVAVESRAFGNLLVRSKRVWYLGVGKLILERKRIVTRRRLPFIYLLFPCTNTPSLSK